MAVLLRAVGSVVVGFEHCVCADSHVLALSNGKSRDNNAEIKVADFGKEGYR